MLGWGWGFVLFRAIIIISMFYTLGDTVYFLKIHYSEEYKIWDTFKGNNCVFSCPQQLNR